MPGGALGSAAAGAIGTGGSGISGSMLASTFLLAGSQALGILTAPGPRRGTAAELSFPPGEASDVIPWMCGTVEIVPHFVTYFGYQNKKVPNDVAKEDMAISAAVQAAAGYISGGGTLVSSPPTAIYLAFLGGMLGAFTAGLGQLRTASYRHYCGFFYEICHGRIDGISAMKVDERLSFAGTDSNAGNTVLVDDPQAWGGDHVDGGTYWLVDIIPGDFWPTQLPNAHLVEMLGSSVPSYSGKACLVIRAPTASFPESGYFAANPGAAPALRPLKLRTHRYPDNLGVPEFKKVNISGVLADANIAECVYEWYTHPSFGVKRIPTSKFDLDSFRLGAETHFDDNLGASLQFNTPTDVESALDTFTSIGDAIVWGGFRSPGSIRYKVIKRDYDIGTIPVFRRGPDGSDPNLYNVTGIGGVSHGAWARTANNYTFRYKDRDNNFIETARPTMDLANYMMQGRVRSLDQNLEGTSNGAQAAFIGTREMRAASYPNAPITIVANRDAYSIEPGDVIKLIDNVLEFVKIIRVAEVRGGTEDTSEIEIVGAEDQYGIGASAYNPFVPAGFTDPVGTAIATTHSKVIEAPFALSRDDDAKLLVFAGKPNGAAINFDTFVSVDAGVSYTQEGSRTDFAITGLITESIARLTGPVLDGLTFTPTNSFDASRLTSATPDQIATGQNILYFEDGEFMAVETITNNGDGTYTLENIWRAVHPFDSVPAPHSAGARVWFITYGKALTGSEYADPTNTRTKVLTRTVSDVLALADATATLLTTDSRSLKPNPVRNVEINGNYLIEEIDGVSDLAVTWNETNRLTDGAVVDQQAVGVDPEDDTTYTVRFYATESGDVLLRTESGLTSPASTLTTAEEVASGSYLGHLSASYRVEIDVVRDGNTSTAYIREVGRDTSVPPIEIVFIDGSEHWATAVDKWKTSTFGTHSAPASGVAGAHGKVTDDSVWDSHGTTITATSTISARGRFRIRVLDNEELILLKNGATVHIALEILSSGAITVNGGGGAFTHTTSTTYSIDTWYDIELIATIHDTTGSYKLLIDGAVPSKSGGGTMEGASLDTRNGATSTVTSLLFGGGTSIDTYVDDHAIDAGGNEIGLGEVETLYPTGPGDLAELTRGGADSGANWSQCDEATQNGDTDYVVSTSTNQRDCYAFQDRSIAGTPRAVQVTVTSMLVSGTPNLKPFLRIGGVNYDPSTAQVQTGDFKCYTAIWNVNPATSAPWSDAAINALQAGPLCVDADIRATQVVIEVFLST